MLNAGIEKNFIEHAVEISFMNKKEVMENSINLMKKVIDEI